VKYSRVDLFIIVGEVPTSSSIPKGINENVLFAFKNKNVPGYVPLRIHEN
jgi:hypothetical protein